jgi:hypothetical protein
MNDRHVSETDVGHLDRVSHLDETALGHLDRVSHPGEATGLLGSWVR